MIVQPIHPGLLAPGESFAEQHPGLVTAIAVLAEVGPFAFVCAAVLAVYFAVTRYWRRLDERARDGEPLRRGRL